MRRPVIVDEVPHYTTSLGVEHSVGCYLPDGAGPVEFGIAYPDTLTWRELVEALHVMGRPKYRTKV